MNTKPKKRTEYIGIRVTPEEKEELQRRAFAVGASLTGFLVGQALRSETEGSSC